MAAAVVDQKMDGTPGGGAVVAGVGGDGIRRFEIIRPGDSLDTNFARLNAAWDVALPVIEAAGGKVVKIIGELETFTGDLNQLNEKRNELEEHLQTRFLVKTYLRKAACEIILRCDAFPHSKALVIPRLASYSGAIDNIQQMSAQVQAIKEHTDAIIQQLQKHETDLHTVDRRQFALADLLDHACDRWKELREKFPKEEPKSWTEWGRDSLRSLTGRCRTSTYAEIQREYEQAKRATIVDKRLSDREIPLRSDLPSVYSAFASLRENVIVTRLNTAQTDYTENESVVAPYTGKISQISGRLFVIRNDHEENVVRRSERGENAISLKDLRKYAIVLKTGLTILKTQNDLLATLITTFKAAIDAQAVPPITEEQFTFLGEISSDLKKEVQSAETLVEETVRKGVHEGRSHVDTYNDLVALKEKAEAELEVSMTEFERVKEMIKKREAEKEKVAQMSAGGAAAAKV